MGFLLIGDQRRRTLTTVISCIKNMRRRLWVVHLPFSPSRLLKYVVRHRLSTTKRILIDYDTYIAIRKTQIE